LALTVDLADKVVKSSEVKGNKTMVASISDLAIGLNEIKLKEN
jgi:hypothetical protein